MTTQSPPTKPGLPFGLPPGYKPDDFLYKGDGPWPSMSEDGNVAPEVLGYKKGSPHCIPKKEDDEWNKFLGTYYDEENFLKNISWEAIKNSEDVLGIDWTWIRKEIENAAIDVFDLHSETPRKRAISWLVRNCCKASSAALTAITGFVEP